ncbi:MAG: hypothetical protein IPM29_31025 [Planctomycetes bacterium]|nr:hypothetical protein [Planctomycetota bacterium]
MIPNHNARSRRSAAWSAGVLAGLLSGTIAAQVPGFGPDVVLSQGSAQPVQGPLVVADVQGVLHAVWTTNDFTTGVMAVSHARFDGAGHRLQPERQLVRTAVLSSAALAADPRSGVQVAWARYLVSGYLLELERLAADGTVVQGPLAIATGLGQGSSPVLACDATGAVHVVWVDAGIRHAKVDPQGAIAVAPHRVVDPGAPRIADQPTLAVDRATGVVHLAWRESTTLSDGRIRYRRLDALGAPLGDELQLSERPPTSPVAAREPQLDVDPYGGVWVVWVDAADTPARGQVHFALLDAQARIRLPETRLSYSPGTVYSPSLAAGPSGVLVAWRDDRPGSWPQVWTLRLRLRGAPGPELRATDLPTGGVATPSVAVDADGRFHLVWWDYRNAPTTGIPLIVGKSESWPSVTPSGPARIGRRVDLALQAALLPGEPFVLALMLGATAGIPLPDGRRVPFDGDDLFLACLDPGIAAALGLAGSQAALDPAGAATVAWTVPPLPALAGLRVYAGFLVLDPLAPLPQSILSFSTPTSLTLLP